MMMTMIMMTVVVMVVLVVVMTIKLACDLRRYGDEKISSSAQKLTASQLSLLIRKCLLCFVHCGQLLGANFISFSTYR